MQLQILCEPVDGRGRIWHNLLTQDWSGLNMLLAFAMRLARRLFFRAVLLAYLVQVFSGMGLHSLLCLDESCSSDCAAPTCPFHRHGVWHGHGGHHEHRQRSERPAEPQRHDPAKCPVCQMLALVVLPHEPLEIQCSGTVALACEGVHATPPDEARRLGFQSRAPPIA